jgi:hypothetical protein
MANDGAFSRPVEYVHEDCRADVLLVVDLDSIRDDLTIVVRQALEAAHVPVRISQRLWLASAMSSVPWSLSVIMRTTGDAVHH